MKLSPVLALVLGFLVASSCGGDEPRPKTGGGEREPSATTPEPAEEAPAESSSGSGRSRRSGSSGSGLESIDSRPYESQELGALHGEILFEGDAPEPFPIGAKDKPECCTFPEVDHMSDTAVVNDGRVRFAFVYVRSGYDQAAVPKPPTAPFVLDQRGCVYTPHVGGIQTGQPLHVTNSDPTTHNVRFAALRNDVRGNKSQGQGGPPLEFVFERQEDSVKFKCDIHPWMLSYLHVIEHPWFSVTDERGEFSIPDLPPGEYGVEVIHERFGEKRGSVTVEAGQSTGFRFTLSD